MGPDRPWWAYIADDLFARCVARKCVPSEARLRINPFLQNWKPTKTNLPDELKSILAAAKHYGLRLEALAPARTILRQMPMWDHAQADKTKIRTLGGCSAATACLKNTHRLVTVGDFERFAMGASEPGHDQISGTCECDQCTYMRLDIGCATPSECYARATVFLNTLPPKWDPRGERPEDYEAAGMQEARLLFEGREDVEIFDRRVTMTGTISDVLRTSGKTSWQDFDEILYFS
ncbi:hypothetical protein BC628DRAFT_1456943 [Trametes gibbosa]|nr:hypothetical protein BC628DRAFT_1456943 [Trametes gibbosa]